MKPVIRSDWLPERSKMGLSCPLGIFRVGPSRKGSLFGSTVQRRMFCTVDVWAVIPGAPNVSFRKISVRKTI